MFMDLATRCPTVAWKLLGAMIEGCNKSNSPRPFQLVKAFEIITHTFKVSSKLVTPNPTETKSLIQEYTQMLLESLPFIFESVGKERIKSVEKSICGVLKRFEEIRDVWCVVELKDVVEKVGSKALSAVFKD
jgi:hypothetical protein